METILKKDIPFFVKDSPYLQTLLSNGPFPDEGIEVPTGCAKRNLDIANESDLITLLLTVRFWMVPEVLETCKEFLHFALDPQNAHVIEETFDEFAVAIPLLRDIKLMAQTGKHIPIEIINDEVVSAYRVRLSISVGNTAIVKFQCEDLRLPTPSNCVALAATFGAVECMKYFHSAGHPLTVESSDFAIDRNQLESLRYLHQIGAPWEVKLLHRAAWLGNLACLQFLVENGCPGLQADFDHILFLAASAGRVHIVEYLWLTFPHFRTQNNEWTVATNAAQSGHVAVLQFAHAQNFSCFATPTSSSTLMSRIVREKCGNVAVLEYLFSVGQVATAVVFRDAVRGGHLACLRVLREHNSPMPVYIDLCKELAQNCQKPAYFECLKHAPEVGIPWTAAAAAAVASTGHLEALKFLHTQGCRWDKRTCDAAAKGGHLDCLQYADENGCPWVIKGYFHVDFDTLLPVTASAVEARSYACLKYVMDRGARLDVRTAGVAAGHGDVAMLKHLLSLDCPVSVATCARAAGSFGEEDADSMGCLVVLREKGCPWDGQTALSAVRVGNLDALRFAHENGCPWDGQTCSTAANHEQLECLAYAHENGCPWDEDTTSCAAAGFTSRALDCLKYAHAHGCPWNKAETMGKVNTRECYNYAREHGCVGESRFDDPDYEDLNDDEDE